MSAQVYYIQHIHKYTTQLIQAYLGSTGFLPPPGGPIAPIYFKSFIYLILRSLSRSYNACLDMRKCNNAIGCCVPYVSTFGIFISSMNTINRLPVGGPKDEPVYVYVV